MGEDHAELCRFHAVEADFVELSAGGLVRRFFLMGGSGPPFAVPYFDDIILGRLDTAAVVVDGQLDAANFALAAEIDLQPIAVGLGFVARPAVVRRGAEADD